MLLELSLEHDNIEIIVTNWQKILAEQPGTLTRLSDVFSPSRRVTRMDYYKLILDQWL